MTTAPAVAAPPTARTTLDYSASLDGMRAIAVAGVVAFHLGHLRGGFLGVDLFFTLSGYLITRLLLLEHRATGGIALGRFWSRRAWRLLPVLYLLVAVLAVYAATVARPDELSGIRGPGISSLTFVANWWFIATGDGYWDLFSAPSPFEHVWSLAIEQQFYVVWPLLVLPLLGRPRAPARLLTLTVTLAGGSTVLLAVLARDDVSRAYFGSGARASSILVGAALAVIVDRGDAWLPAAARSRVAPWVAGAATAFLVWSWITIDGATDLGFYTGGFLVHAVAVATIVAFLLHRPGGLAARILSFEPLRRLGLISYGVYLWHWPAIVLLDSERTGLDGAPLLLTRLGVTLAVSVGSYLVVEQPARHQLSKRVPALVAFPTAALVLAGAVWVATIPPAAPVAIGNAPPPPPAAPLPEPATDDTGTDDTASGDTATGDTAVATPPATEATEPAATPAVDTEDEPADRSADDAERGTLIRTTPATLPTLPAPSAEDPLRVLLVGDSYMYDAQPGIVAALEATGVVVAAEGAQLGFSLANDGWDDALERLVEEHRPDLVAAMWARFDVRWLESNPLDEYEARLDRAVDILTSDGATVAFFGLAPSLTAGVDREPVDRSINDVFAAMPFRHPGEAFYVDPDPIVAPDGEPDRRLETPEGSLLVRKVDVSHFCGDGAARYGLALGELVQRLTGAAPADPARWWAGEWRFDPRYDDPPGACA
jgi:peptidoglycan/LPS O-acetylase OafA/YrhL